MSGSRLSPPRPLTPQMDTGAFDCGHPAMNDWLTRHAARNEGLASRSFAVCEDARVVAYCSLAAGAVSRADAPSALARNMPDPIPVVVLGRLAVDRAWAGQGLGAALLRDALARALSVSEHVGARAMLVHAIDEAAAGFYRPYGFKSFRSQPRTLYMPLRDVAAAL